MNNQEKRTIGKQNRNTQPEDLPKYNHHHKARKQKPWTSSSSLSSSLSSSFLCSLYWVFPVMCCGILSIQILGSNLWWLGREHLLSPRNCRTLPQIGGTCGSSQITAWVIPTGRDYKAFHQACPPVPSCSPSSTPLPMRFPSTSSVSLSHRGKSSWSMCSLTQSSTKGHQLCPLSWWPHLFPCHYSLLKLCSHLTTLLPTRSPLFTSIDHRGLQPHPVLSPHHCTCPAGGQGTQQTFGDAPLRPPHLDTLNHYSLTFGGTVTSLLQWWWADRGSSAGTTGEWHCTLHSQGQSQVPAPH